MLMQLISFEVNYTSAYHLILHTAYNSVVDKIKCADVLGTV